MRRKKGLKAVLKRRSSGGNAHQRRLRRRRQNQKRDNEKNDLVVSDTRNPTINHQINSRRLLERLSDFFNQVLDWAVSNRPGGANCQKGLEVT